MTYPRAPKLFERRKKGQLSRRWGSTVQSDRRPKKCEDQTRILAASSRFGRKFAFPSRDHHAREAIAEHVDGGAPHIH